MGKTRPVKILNPLPGGNKFTTLTSARRQVRRGHAVLSHDQSELFFVVSKRRHTSAIRSAINRIPGYWYDVAKMTRMPIAEDNRTTQTVGNTVGHNPLRSAAFHPKADRVRPEKLITRSVF